MLNDGISTRITIICSSISLFLLHFITIFFTSLYSEYNKDNGDQNTWFSLSFDKIANKSSMSL